MPVLVSFAEPPPLLSALAVSPDALENAAHAGSIAPITRPIPTARESFLSMFEKARYEAFKLRKTVAPEASSSTVRADGGGARLCPESRKSASLIAPSP
jgi:hypothetical protein